MIRLLHKLHIDALRTEAQLKAILCGANLDYHAMRVLHRQERAARRQRGTRASCCVISREVINIRQIVNISGRVH